MAKTAATKKEESPEAIRKKLVLTGADIVAIGEEAELLVGGKNYNTALISQIEGIQAPYFRAISSLAFHRVLDETKVTGRIVRAVVDREYGRIDWNDPEINQDPDFLQKFVRQLGKQIHDAAAAEGDQSHTKLAHLHQYHRGRLCYLSRRYRPAAQTFCHGAGRHPVRGSSPGRG